MQTVFPPPYLLIFFPVVFILSYRVAFRISSALYYAIIVLPDFFVDVDYLRFDRSSSFLFAVRKVGGVFV